MKNRIIISIVVIVILYGLMLVIKTINWNSKHEVGEVVDTFNSINVYYNGGVSNSQGRNLSADGYNIGMKYQCVEFIKRYYYEHLKHKMPDSYGNAIDFYGTKIKDGDINTKRDLIQYSNPSITKPKEDDIIIFNKSLFNSYGHVAIICKVGNDFVEIIQQNPGPFGRSREKIALKH
ncbi:MAG: CHAP domain-containing protein, partial [Flavobacterium sp.]